MITAQETINDWKARGIYATEAARGESNEFMRAMLYRHVGDLGEAFAARWVWEMDVRQLGAETASRVVAEKLDTMLATMRELVLERVQERMLHGYEEATT